MCETKHIDYIYKHICTPNLLAIRKIDWKHKNVQHGEDIKISREIFFPFQS